MNGGTAVQPMYFELTANDPGQALQLFHTIFGWHFERFAMPHEYCRIPAGPESAPGIQRSFNINT